MYDVLILAIALSMDAFAVAVGLGAKQNAPKLPLRAGIYFGVFQALMPFIGYLGGKSVLGWVQAYTHWIAFGLLVVIGVKMMIEGLSEGVEEAIAKVTHKMMLMLAIATSIDAMAAGFSLTLLNASPYVACVTIGLVTFGFSAAGVLVGRRSGTWLEGKAELFGGLVLVLMGFKFLFA